MSKKLLTVAALVGSASAASAGGLDRSGQNIGILFETGNLIELSFGFTDPTVEGVENGSTLTTNQIANVADNFNTAALALRYELNDQWSFAVIGDEPYGSDVLYGGDPATTALGGTGATVDSTAITALARYKLNDNFSLHGGVRYQELTAAVSLGGNAFGGLNGYNAEFGSDAAFGYVLGAAYERPDIALRVALTYSSEIEHDLNTVETVNGILVNPGTLTEVVTPESLNLDFQTGIAKNTLLFGSIRYARYSDTIVSPTFFDSAVNSASSGDSLTDIESTTDFEIGVGRRFTDKFSGSVAIGYESVQDDNLVSPLAPTNGAAYVTVGGSYQFNEQVKLSGGIRYTDLGNAFPETGTPDTARADFSGNDAISVGLKLSYSF